MNEASHVRPVDPRGWIGSLPGAIAPQAALLLRLFDAVDADPRIRAFRVRGSLARGTADEHSDLDTRIWIADDAYEATLADLPGLVRSLGPTVDVLFETPESPYLFVQFEDGVQLELSSGRASEASGRDRGVVVLLDRDGLWDGPDEPEPPWDQGLWLGWAWMALSDVDKFLRRSSPWEALIALEKVRSLLLRHHAAELGLRDPEYGLTSILDYGGTLPAGLEATVAGLDPAEIRRAARASAELLAAYGRRPFADWVIARLAGR
jgi:predicted nucleotidyltransferase